jgi:RimJ/RimL family protein N-acetyltransferase
VAINLPNPALRNLVSAFFALVGLSRLVTHVLSPNQRSGKIEEDGGASWEAKHSMADTRTEMAMNFLAEKVRDGECMREDEDDIRHHQAPIAVALHQSPARRPTHR